MNPTIKDIQVDPVLTSVAVDFQNDEYVADMIMPLVDVKSKSGIYFVYDKSKFRQVDDLRAPGERSNRADYGMSQANYGPLVEHSLEDDIPDEIADEYPARLDAYSDATEQIKERLLVNRELRVANLLADTAVVTQNITLSGTSRWDDYANSDPIGDVDTGRQAVRTGVLKKPNTLLLGDAVFEALRHHPDLLERFKYSERGVLTTEHLASLFRVKKIIVASAQYNTAEEGQADSMADIWGKNAWLLYVESRPRIKSVSFGYTLSIKKDRDKVERWREAPKKTIFVRVNGGKSEEKIVAAGGAYLIKTAVN